MGYEYMTKLEIRVAEQEARERALWRDELYRLPLEKQIELSLEAADYYVRTSKGREQFFGVIHVNDHEMINRYLGDNKERLIAEATARGEYNDKHDYMLYFEEADTIESIRADDKEYLEYHIDASEDEIINYLIEINS